jgi:hypothetical protein
MQSCAHQLYHVDLYVVAWKQCTEHTFIKRDSLG